MTNEHPSHLHHWIDKPRELLLSLPWLLYLFFTLFFCPLLSSERITNGLHYDHEGILCERPLQRALQRHKTLKWRPLLPYCVSEEFWHSLLVMVGFQSITPESKISLLAKARSSQVSIKQNLNIRYVQLLLFASFFLSKKMENYHKSVQE